MLDSPPLLSIIIPNYNYEKYIGATLVRDFLFPGAPDDRLISTKSIGRLLRRHLAALTPAPNFKLLRAESRQFHAAGRRGLR
jgi:hypothetical protein